MFGRGPKIPARLLRPMTQLSTDVRLDQSQGGQWIPDRPQEIPFRGVIMPLSNEDLQYAPPGTYSSLSQKLYTNGHRLSVGAKVRDSYDGREYTVTNELTHGPIHSLQRYVVEAKGESAPR